jgi:hypothetical protein
LYDSLYDFQNHHGTSANSAHTVTKTAALHAAESAADLVMVLRNISDGLTVLLR